MGVRANARAIGGLDAPFDSDGCRTRHRRVRRGLLGPGTTSDQADRIQRSSFVRVAVNPGCYHQGWQFDTKSSATRSVGHGFYAGDEIAVNPPLFTVPANPPYLGQQHFPSRLQVECTFVHKSMLAMAANSTITCGMLNDWVVSSTVTYGLHMAPEFTGAPETTDIQIVCNAADSVGCNDWTLEPLPQGAIGRLGQQVAGRGNNVTKTDEGDFNVRFLIHVTRP